MSPLRCRTKPDKSHADLVCDILHVTQVGVHFVACLVNGLERRARQFKLPTRLKAYIGAVFLQPDEFAGFLYRCPAVAVPKPFENGQNTAFTFKRDRRERVTAISEFFVLSANAPIYLRLAATLKIPGQLAMMFDRSAAGLGNGHGCLRRKVWEVVARNRMGVKARWRGPLASYWCVIASGSGFSSRCQRRVRGVSCPLAARSRRSIRMPGRLEK